MREGDGSFHTPSANLILKQSYPAQGVAFLFPGLSFFRIRTVQQLP